MTLEKVPSGTRVFVDAPIFIYHFTGASAECRSFLERCERSDVKGATSVVVLAGVAHRLMMIEALSRGLVTPGTISRKLREKPELVRQLHAYQEQVERIPLMGIDVIPLDVKTLLRSAEVRRHDGLLTDDSLVATAAREEGITSVATADADLERVSGLTVYQPRDLS